MDEEANNEEESMTTDSMTFTALELARHLEADVSHFGWDMPATLFDIKGTDLPDELIEALKALGPSKTAELAAFVSNDDDDDDETFLASFGICHAKTFADHPFYGMIGMHADPDVLGCVIVTEGWQYPDEVNQAMGRGEPRPDVMPSQHPRRVEVRISNVMWRDGTSVSLVRRRDTDEVMDDPELQFGGRVYDAMARYLGRETTWMPDPSERLTPAIVHARRAYATIMAQFILAPPDARPGDDPATAFARLVSLTPAEVMALGLGALGAGLGSLLECQIDNMINRVPPSALGGEAPAPSSEEDRAAWERVRSEGVQFLETMLSKVDDFTAETGKRRIKNIPVVEAKRKLTEKLADFSWYDAQMIASDLAPRTCPDDQETADALNRLLDRGKGEAAIAAVLAIWAGLSNRSLDWD